MSRKSNDRFTKSTPLPRRYGYVDRASGNNRFSDSKSATDRDLRAFVNEDGNPKSKLEIAFMMAMADLKNRTYR